MPELKERSARRIFFEHRRPRRSPFSLSPHSECPAEKGPLLLPPSPPTARLSMLTRRREPCRAFVHWSEARDAHLSRARQGSRFLPPVSRKLQPAATRHANSLDPPPTFFLPSFSLCLFLSHLLLSSKTLTTRPLQRPSSPTSAPRAGRAASASSSSPTPRWRPGWSRRRTRSTGARLRPSAPCPRRRGAGRRRRAAGPARRRRRRRRP